MTAVADELERRGSRAALSALFSHENPQVRLQAAETTFAIFPQEARAVLQQIADRDEWPCGLDARLTLRLLADGIFIPK